MPADRSYGALLVAVDRWARAYAECQAKHGGVVEAYDGARAEYDAAGSQR
jgi:hypothetical protein